MAQTKKPKLSEYTGLRISSFKINKKTFNIISKESFVLDSSSYSIYFNDFIETITANRYNYQHDSLSRTDIPYSYAEGRYAFVLKNWDFKNETNHTVYLRKYNSKNESIYPKIRFTRRRKYFYIGSSVGVIAQGGLSYYPSWDIFIQKKINPRTSIIYKINHSWLNIGNKTSFFTSAILNSKVDLFANHRNIRKRSLLNVSINGGLSQYLFYNAISTTTSANLGSTISYKLQDYWNLDLSAEHFLLLNKSHYNKISISIGRLFQKGRGCGKFR